jgi:hypothetical protein
MSRIVPFEIRVVLPESFDDIIRLTNKLEEGSRITSDARILFICGLLGSFAIACERPDVQDDLFLLNDDELSVT